MNKKRICSIFVAIAVSTGIVTNVYAYGVAYLPDVTKTVQHSKAMCKVQ